MGESFFPSHEPAHLMPPLRSSCFLARSMAPVHHHVNAAPSSHQCRRDSGGRLVSIALARVYLRVPMRLHIGLAAVSR